jgi:hypothetical protein
MRYPNLIDHLVPFDSPMEVTAAHARAAVSRQHDVPAGKIGVFFISPCPAKRTAVNNPIGRTKSQVDGVIAIADAYPLILANLDKMDPRFSDTLESDMAGSTGVRWAYAGGEAIALKMDRFLAVDGIHNVIAILDEVENDRLQDVDFIEANACIGGCIGGPLTVANRFSAHARQRAFVAGAASAHERGPAGSPLSKRLDPWPEKPLPNPAMQLDDDIVLALQKYEQMKKIAADLPGLDCGACGAPDCEALAEDIVRGEATETDCIFKLKERIRSVAAQMGELEREMNRHVLKGDAKPDDHNP